MTSTPGRKNFFKKLLTFLKIFAIILIEKKGNKQNSERMVIVMMIGVPDFSLFEVRNCIIEELLKKIVASNSKCKKCALNHDGVCFFAYNCVTADFSYQKERDNK